MKHFTQESILEDVFENPEFSRIKKYLLYSPVMKLDQSTDFRKLSIRELAGFGWISESVVAGLNYLADQISSDRFEIHFVYEDKNCQDDSMKKDVNLIRMLPERADESKPYIILAAGGGYQGVCNMVEALPTARHMTEAGYQVFLLTYRVSAGNTLPKALDDLAEAVNYIKKHSDFFHINPDFYAIGGFSAGANLISCWGVPAIGYQKYGAAKPTAMFPVYPFIDLEQEKHIKSREGMLEVMFDDVNDTLVEQYNVAVHIDGNYPPCFIVCGKDDTMVSPANSELLKKLLDEADVLAVLEEGEHAPHGFGDGTGCDVEGWPERAISFLAELSK